MILVLSSNHYEQATERIIDWLLYYDHPFVRLSAQDLLRPDNEWRIDVHTATFHYRGQNLNHQVGAVLNRRFVVPHPTPGSGNNNHESHLYRELVAEGQDLRNFFLSGLADRFWLPKPRSAELAGNKLTMMPLAAASGLPVPRTYVCRRKTEIARLLAKAGTRWIIKPIHHCRYYSDGDRVFTAFTKSFDKTDLEHLPDEFYPSLIQERVASTAELRVFYLDGKFYTEACFEPSSTPIGEVDIKLRQASGSLHFVPYALPASVRDALTKLFRKVDLNTGSADLLLGEDGHYYFLEINPTGQFSAPSEKNNWHLEKKVAELLIRKDNEHVRRPSSQAVPQRPTVRPELTIPQPA